MSASHDRCAFAPHKTFQGLERMVRRERHVAKLDGQDRQPSRRSSLVLRYCSVTNIWTVPVPLASGLSALPRTVPGRTSWPALMA